MNGTLHLNPDGTITAVATDDVTFLLREIGATVQQRRASHVWPEHPGKRAVFRLLRMLFGERGHVACWCRQWQGPWQVRFADHPRKVVFVHQSRKVCIDWEVKQLNEKLAT